MPRRPFPATIERKRELMAAIVREGGQPLLDLVEEWRATFPGARLVKVKAGNVDVGEPDPPRAKCEVFNDNHPAMTWLRSPFNPANKKK